MVRYQSVNIFIPAFLYRLWLTSSAADILVETAETVGENSTPHVTNLIKTHDTVGFIKMVWLKHEIAFQCYN